MKDAVLTVRLPRRTRARIEEAARAVGAQLVSADEALDGHGVERVWE